MSTSEIFKSLPSDTRYMLTIYGEVFSKNTGTQLEVYGVKYPYVILYQPGSTKSTISKRIVDLMLETYLDSLKENQTIEYLDKNTKNCSLSNLKIVTFSFESFKNEIWKVITRYIDYEVSSCGRVRRTTPQRNAQKRKLPYLISLHDDGEGYLGARLCINGKPFTEKVHRLVAETFLEKPKGSNIVVHHKDHNKYNNNIENLEYSTQINNVREYYKTQTLRTYDTAIYTPNPHNIDDKNEQWKDVVLPSFGHYQISNWGNVINTKIFPNKEMKNLKPLLDKDGYPRVMLRAGKDKCKLVPIHTLVMLTFVGDRPENAVINHRDGNKLNCKVSNLEYITHGENRKHAIDSGLVSKYMCLKLTEDDVKEIRSMHSSGISQKDIAVKFSVTAPTISAIITGKTWRNKGK